MLLLVFKKQTSKKNFLHGGKWVVQSNLALLCCKMVNSFVCFLAAFRGSVSDVQFPVRIFLLQSLSRKWKVSLN